MGLFLDKLDARNQTNGNHPQVIRKRHVTCEPDIFHEFNEYFNCKFGSFWNSDCSFSQARAQLQNRSFHVVERTRTSAKCEKTKNARAKRAEQLFFVVKYANLWRSRYRRGRGCLNSLMIFLRRSFDLHKLESQFFFFQTKPSVLKINQFAIVLGRPQRPEEHSYLIRSSLDWNITIKKLYEFFALLRFSGIIYNKSNDC